MGQIGRNRYCAFMGFPLAEIYEALAPEGTLEGKQAFIQAYRNHYRTQCTQTTRPYPGVAGTLAVMTCCKLAVATANPTWSALQVLEAFDLARSFHHVQGSENLLAKPAPDILLAACRQLDVDPDDCVMVGDTDRDVLSARAAGMRCVAVTYGAWPADRLRDLDPDGMVDHFELLPAAIAGL
jgi:HAD superfamily hydrolase (TIGR01509 family)